MTPVQRLDAAITITMLVALVAIILGNFLGSWMSR